MTNTPGKILAVSFLALGVTISGANASCERKTTGTIVGAGAGGILGSVITHASPVGIVGGAVAGGLVGNAVSHCPSHYSRAHYERHAYYYDRYGHRHYYR